ncbi:MAG TPA: hypothetical protein VM115_11830 [Vicinamibacterales bacterium]|nr:hypothetical protein [Vicinamibacterales bacterium]
MVRVRLTKKLAAKLNGIDVSALNVGDILELPDAAACMLIAERWAEPALEPLQHVVIKNQSSVDLAS